MLHLAALHACNALRTVRQYRSNAETIKLLLQLDSLTTVLITQRLTIIQCIDITQIETG